MYIMYVITIQYVFNNIDTDGLTITYPCHTKQTTVRQLLATPLHNSVGYVIEKKL